MTAIDTDTTAVSRSKIKDADQWLQSKFGLFGALRRCQGQHWWAATTEFLITIIFALLPIVIPFAALPMFGRNITPLGDTFWAQIQNGELYLLATGILAPLYYFTFPKRGNGGSSIVVFPSQQVLILVFIATISITVLAVAATKVQAEGERIPSYMIDFSQLLFLFCAILFFLTLAVKHSLPDITEQVYDEESRRQERESPPNDPLDTSSHVDPEEFIRETLAAHVQKEQK